MRHYPYAPASAGWQAWGNAAARPYRTGWVQVRAADLTTDVDETTHQPVVTLGALVWEGLARLQNMGDDSQRNLAGQDVRLRDYRLTVDVSATPSVAFDSGQVVRFILTPDHPTVADSRLLGRVLVVGGVILGSQRFERVLTLTDEQG